MSGLSFTTENEMESPFNKTVRDQGKKIDKQNDEIKRQGRLINIVVIVLLFMVASMVIGLLIAIWQARQPSNVIQIIDSHGVCTHTDTKL